MKHLINYKLFESGISDLPTGSLSEEMYFLFEDYAEKHSIKWTNKEGEFGLNDIPEYIIAESDKCVVMDIYFPKGYKATKEFYDDIAEFINRLKGITGHSPIIKYSKGYLEYTKTSRMLQILINK